MPPTTSLHVWALPGTCAGQDKRWFAAVSEFTTRRFLTIRKLITRSAVRRESLISPLRRARSAFLPPSVPLPCPPFPQARPYPCAASTFVPVARRSITSFYRFQL